MLLGETSTSTSTKIRTRPTTRGTALGSPRLLGRLALLLLLLLLRLAVGMGMDMMGTGLVPVLVRVWGGKRSRKSSSSSSWRRREEDPGARRVRGGCGGRRRLTGVWPPFRDRRVHRLAAVPVVVRGRGRCRLYLLLRGWLCPLARRVVWDGGFRQVLSIIRVRPIRAQGMRLPSWRGIGLLGSWREMVVGGGDRGHCVAR